MLCSSRLVCSLLFTVHPLSLTRTPFLLARSRARGPAWPVGGRRGRDVPQAACGGPARADEESAGEGSPAAEGRFSFLWAFVCVFVAPVREVKLFKCLYI